VSSARVHPIMALSNHDELAEQRFVVAFKSYIAAQLDPVIRRLAEDAAEATRGTPDETPSLTRLRPVLAKQQPY